MQQKTSQRLLGLAEFGVTCLHINEHHVTQLHSCGSI